MAQRHLRSRPESLQRPQQHQKIPLRQNRRPPSNLLLLRRRLHARRRNRPKRHQRRAHNLPLPPLIRRQTPWAEPNKRAPPRLDPSPLRSPVHALLPDGLGLAFRATILPPLVAHGSDCDFGGRGGREGADQGDYEGLGIVEGGGVGVGGSGDGEGVGAAER